MSKIAFLFAGQGAQYVGMGRDLYENVPAAKEVFDLGESRRPGTLATCFEGPGEALTQTENTQPALFLVDLACARALSAAGVMPDAVAGFSLGEIPALAFTGILSDADAFDTVVLRGNTMQTCGERHPGGMAAVMKLPPEEVERIAATFNCIYPVNYNCPGQIACAGAAGEIDAFCDAVKAAGGRAVKLAVSGAFHTPFMADATDALRRHLSGLALSAPKIPLYSDYTADLYPGDSEKIAETIAEQASRSVRWETIIRRMADTGIDTFIEVGAGATLSKLVSRTLTDVQILHVENAETLRETLAALGK
ncbi:MAG: ACP S-malonyltransferase [Eubacteriales bacterium]|nr:ACP S-malonyltransferase [Eubacteriales bacterium]